LFNINVQNRPYDLHRPHGCTVLVIELAQWPGNEFGLWLPETVYCDHKIAWCNWSGDVFQKWEGDAETLSWFKQLDGFSITSTLQVDPQNTCLWYQHSFQNTGEKVLSELNTQTCFHLVNAPEFISIRGERLWACLDHQWMTTDQVPREQSPDPRRVSFLKTGLRTERTIIPNMDFPSATMAEQACHPLMIAERIGLPGSVAIACRNFRMVFNNNDPILRCIHSEPLAIGSLAIKESASQEGVILFSKGNHQMILEEFERLVAPRWAATSG
jgi:hypothetical protein